MSWTVNDVYTEVCRTMLENSGLSLVYTEASFLKDIRACVAEFLQTTQLTTSISVMRIVSGTSEYSLPVSAMAVKEVFVDQGAIEPSSGTYLDNDSREWESDSGSPQFWRQDRVAANKVELTPAPNWTGTTIVSEPSSSLSDSPTNLMVIATSQPLADTFTTATALTAVPDSFCPYLKYGCLEKIFLTDGESKDIQRAAYCRARWEEGMNIAKAVMVEDLG